MYHNIEFRDSGLAELELPGSAHLTQVFLKPGTRMRARVDPYVLESRRGPIEVADLISEDGSVARAGPFAFFRFLEE